MALQVKADGREFDSILSMLGLSGLPRDAAESASDSAPADRTGPPDAAPANAASATNASVPPAPDSGPGETGLPTPSPTTKESVLKRILSGGSASAPDVAAPPLDLGNNPGGLPPTSVAPIPTTPGVRPTFTEEHPTLSKILRVALTEAEGGIHGLASNAQTYAQTGRNAGFGGGVYGAETMPLSLEREQLQNEQVKQMLPFLRAQQIVGIGQKQSEIAKNTADAGRATAEGGKATAETAAIPAKQKLEEAQTAAAAWKEEPATGLLRNVVTGATMQPGDSGMAILDAPSAAILGKNPGDHVPLKIAKQAKDLAEEGLSYTQAGGHNWLVDKQGNKLKDMGTATPLAVIGTQMSGPATTASGALADPNMEAVAQSVAAGKQDMATALRPYMRFPGTANALEARVLAVNPDYYQGDYQNRLKVLEKATQGSWADQKIAFNTMIQHAELLRQAAKELNNGNMRTLAGLSNRAQSEFGDPALTNFDAISNAYNHEVTSVIGKGHISDAEVKTGGATMPSNANYATIDKVLGSYESLAKSKMGFLQKQIDAGMKGTKGLTDTNQPPANTSGPTATDLLKKYPPTPR